MSYTTPFSPLLKEDQTLICNEAKIAYRSSDGFVRVTEMCKVFRTDISQWKRLKGTAAFLDQLAASLQKHRNELIVYESGSNEQRSTWVHPQVAIEVARWLSPELQVRITKWVYELTSTGKVELGKEKTSAEIDTVWKQKISILEDEIIALKDINTKLIDNRQCREEEMKELKTENVQIRAELTEEKTERTRIEKNHNALLKKRQYHKYQRDYCFYVWKDPSPNHLNHKLGYADKGIDKRLQDERTAFPNFKLVMLVYTMKAKFLEETMLNHFEDKLLELNHEFVSGVSSEEIIVATQKAINFNKLEHEIETDLSKYNLTMPNEEIHPDAKAVVTEMIERQIDSEIQPKERFECTWAGCSKTFSKKCHLYRHVRQIHEKSEQVQCPECHVMLACADSLKSHLLTHEETKPICSICKKEMANKSSLHRHILSMHSDNGKVPCPQCKKLISKSGLRLHIRRVHEKSVEFPCEKCGKILRSKANYDYHVQKVCPNLSPESP